MLMLLSTMFGVTALAGREGILVNDITGSPSKYYNLVVLINGRVDSVKSVPEGSRSGYYYLKDTTDTIIPAATNQLPMSGSILSVKGMVKFTADGPYLAEVSRQKAIVTSTGKILSAGDIPPLAVALIVLGLLLVVLAIIVVIFLRKNSSAKTEANFDQVYCASCQNSFPADQHFIVCPNCGSELTSLAGGILPLGHKKIRKKTMELSNAYFEIVSGMHKGDVFRLNIASDQLNIGREDGENDLRLDDDMVSKEHAKILFENDRFYLADRGSKNGTFLQHKKEDNSFGSEVFCRREEMHDGDQLRLGETKLVFHRDKGN
jgi:ribosomal protein S27E